MIAKPAPLCPGELIGVVAPAGAVDAEAVAAGTAVLEDAGFAVRLGASVSRRHGYLAGTDAERAADLTAMLRDPAVRAVFAARGGYGSGRVLPLIDPELVRAASKIFLAHSDCTFLLNDFVQRAGVVTFHGPMVTGFPARRAAVEALMTILSGGGAGWTVTAPDIIQPGSAEGVLVGGCLAMVASMLGTPYAIDTHERLLFLEDVNERPFRIDRMLTQLRQAGAFDGVAGVIFGEMVECVGPGDDAVSVRDVVADMFADAPFPVVFGLPSGHGLGTVTLPLGIRARLAAGQLTFLESPVSGGGS